MNRIAFGMMMLVAMIVIIGLSAPATAQPKGKGGKNNREDLVEKFLSFDKNKDGKVTREEVTDDRLHRLFDKIDAESKGVVTKEQLEEFTKKEADSGPKGKGPKSGS